MIVELEKNKSQGVRTVNYRDLAEYLRVIIDIYSSASIAPDLWLRDREKDFFIATIINVLNGDTNPLSELSLQRYKKYFGNKN